MRTFFLALALLSTSLAQAQGPLSLPKAGTPHRTILLGPELSLSRLQSSQAQERFGNPQGQVNGIYPTWRLVKPTVADDSSAPRRIQFDQDIDFDYRSRSKSSLLTAPLDLFAKQVIVRGQERLFWKVGACAVLTQLYSEPEGIKRGWRLATGGVISGGITLGNALSLEAGYRRLSRVRGFDLSSHFITASLRFPVGRTR